MKRPTNKLRFLNTKRLKYNPHELGGYHSYEHVLVLQQWWEDAAKVGEWRDIEIEYDDLPQIKQGVVEDTPPPPEDRIIKEGEQPIPPKTEKPVIKPEYISRRPWWKRKK